MRLLALGTRPVISGTGRPAWCPSTTRPGIAHTRGSTVIGRAGTGTVVRGTARTWWRLATVPPLVVTRRGSNEPRQRWTVSSPSRTVLMRPRTVTMPLTTAARRTPTVRPCSRIGREETEGSLLSWCRCRARRRHRAGPGLDSAEDPLREAHPSADGRQASGRDAFQRSSRFPCPLRLVPSDGKHRPVVPRCHQPGLLAASPSARECSRTRWRRHRRQRPPLWWTTKPTEPGSLVAGTALSLGGRGWA